MWARKAQAPTARACHRIPGHGPRGAVGLGRIGRAALPLSRRGPARHRHCIPGDGEAREAAAASMRSRWRTGRPPPRRRSSQRGGVCAPRDSSSETPRGPLTAPCLRRPPSPRTRPPLALRPRAPRRDAGRTPGPRAAPPSARRGAAHTSFWPRAQISLTSLWPLTRRASPSTPAPCPSLFAPRQGLSLACPPLASPAGPSRRSGQGTQCPSPGVSVSRSRRT